MSVKSFFGNLWSKAKEHAPGILTGLGIGGMLTGTILAVKATPEAMRRIEEKKEEEGHERLTAWQTVQATWQCYLGAMISEVAGGACLIGALKEGEKRQAALSLAADMGRDAIREFQDYRKFVAEQVGQKKEAEIYNRAEQEVVNRNPPPATMQPSYVEGTAPKPVCCDKQFKRYIYVDYETVASAVNRLNARITNSLEQYVSLNDFYDEIGAERIDMGEKLGWSVETGSIEIPDKKDLQYAGTPNGWPCWVLEFINPPQYEYKFFRKH